MIVLLKAFRRLEQSNWVGQSLTERKDERQGIGESEWMFCRAGTRSGRARNLQSPY